MLEESRSLGLLGPGPVERQYEHAADLARAIGPVEGRVLDLGSGGGLPGLVLVHTWPRATFVLLDAQRRRAEFLEHAVASLELGDRVAVECGRAEVVARRDDLRARFDLVVARSFGPPPVTAECAVGFIRAGGSLVVTEPPHDGDGGTHRWDQTGLARLGFSAPVEIRAGETGTVRVLHDDGPDARWPRRDGVPSKRPLW